jgi:hypothetical protein
VPPPLLIVLPLGEDASAAPSARPSCLQRLPGVSSLGGSCALVGISPC